MTISALSIAEDATLSATGGTATGVLSKGNTENKHTVLFDDSSEFLAQTSFQFVNVDPKVNSGAPNGYTQARRSFVIHEPLALDNGAYTTNSAKFELSVDPETTDAEILSLRVRAAQTIYLSAMDEFFNNGSVA